MGKDFFGEEVQNLMNGNPDVYRLYENAVRSGEPGSAVFDAGFGERFATAYPVVYGPQGQIMTVILSTPTGSNIFRDRKCIIRSEVTDNNYSYSHYLCDLCANLLYSQT